MNNEYSNTLYDLKKIFIDSETPELISYIVTNTQHTSIIKLLDIGSGDLSGLISIAKRLKRYGKQILADAIDIHHPPMRKKIPSNLTISRISGDFMTLPFQDRYDIVLCRQALYYLSNQKQAIRKMSSLLQDGGFITIITWDKGCFLRKLCAKYQPKSPSSDLGKSKLKTFGKNLGLKYHALSFTGSVDMGLYRTHNKNLAPLASLILRGPRTSQRSIRKLTEELLIIPNIVKRVNTVVFFKK